MESGHYVRQISHLDNYSSRSDDEKISFENARLQIDLATLPASSLRTTRWTMTTIFGEIQAEPFTRYQNCEKSPRCGSNHGGKFCAIKITRAARTFH